MAPHQAAQQGHAAPRDDDGGFLRPAPAFARVGFRILSSIAPPVAERAALWLFCKPSRARTRPAELAVLDSGERIRLSAAGFDLAAWSWGAGPIIVLHHGWNGAASHMTAFVRPLVRAGFRAVAYDAPAHGASPGRITSAPEMAGVLHAASIELGGIHGVIAHSVGGAATMIAIRGGMRVAGAVVLAPPAQLEGYVEIFGDHLGLSVRIREGMARRVAARCGMSWSEMNVEAWARGPRPPLLVVHDAGDPIVPRAEAERIRDAWSGAELLATTGLGHRGVRRDAAVVERAVAFLGA